MRKLRIRLIAILVLIALGTAPGLSGAQHPKAYDGHWWLSDYTSGAVKYGFINGYWDCYINTYRGRANYLLSTTEDMITHVYNFYRTNPSKLGMPVPEVMYQFRAPKEAKAPRGGEVGLVRPHDSAYYYNGQYWGWSGKRFDLGFVEGYLWCWRNCLHNKGGTFSKTPEEYVKLIDGWYRMDRATGYISPGRDCTPIGEVLYKFRDGQQPERRSKK